MTNAACDSWTMTCIRFSEIERYVPALPGLYEIYKDDGAALKVGIGVNLRKRLIQHRKSPPEQTDPQGWR